jgi:2-polyprenyl-3-methyl-5-hydroxy-6-metoxy-1,4-benzoquinol methylase
MGLPPTLRTAYRGAPRRERLHVAGRWLSCPLTATASHVPAAGRVLEIGCGHGLFSLLLADESASRDVVGVDVDRDKIAVASAAALSGGIGNARFEVVSPDALPLGDWDAVAIVDVLYLLGHEQATRLVSAAAEVLAPGGVLVVKEMDQHPRWKYAVNQLQELVATRVARITEGDHVDVVPPDLIAKAAHNAGLDVTHHALDRGYPHPHHLVVARRAG